MSSCWAESTGELGAAVSAVAAGYQASATVCKVLGRGARKPGVPASGVDGGTCSVTLLTESHVQARGRWGRATFREERLPLDAEGGVRVPSGNPGELVSCDLSHTVPVRHVQTSAVNEHTREILCCLCPSH